MTPKFLQSDDPEHDIIKTKHIISIHRGKRFITFKIKNSEDIEWFFKTINSATESYLKIKESLKDVKMIV